MDYTSPFQQWLDNNFKGVIASPEIMTYLAKAFEGGRLFEQEDVATMFEGEEHGVISAAIRARKF